jgi:hypothetical protein
MLLSKLGSNRSGPGRAFAYKTLSEAGVVLGFGSDWPVVEVEPWTSVFAAVYRRDPPSPSSSSSSDGGSGLDSPAAAAAAAADGGSGDSDGEGNDVGAKVWESEGERLGLSEVLLGHTLHAAHVARLDQWVGQLAVGYKADFIVLDVSPFSDSSAFAAGGVGSGGVSEAARAVHGGDAVRNAAPGFGDGAGDDSGDGGGVTSSAGMPVGGMHSGREGAGPGQGAGLAGGLPVVQQTYMDGVCVYGCDERSVDAAE